MPETFFGFIKRSMGKSGVLFVLGAGFFWTGKCAEVFQHPVYSYRSSPSIFAADSDSSWKPGPLFSNHSVHNASRVRGDSEIFHSVVQRVAVNVVNNASGWGDHSMHLSYNSMGVASVGCLSNTKAYLLVGKKRWFYFRDVPCSHPFMDSIEPLPVSGLTEVMDWPFPPEQKSVGVNQAFVDQMSGRKSKYIFHARNPATVNINCQYA